MVPSLKLTAIKKQIPQQLRLSITLWQNRKHTRLVSSAQMSLGFFFPSKKHYQRLTAEFLDMRDMLVTDQAGTHVAACMRGPRPRLINTKIMMFYLQGEKVNH